MYSDFSLFIFSLLLNLVNVWSLLSLLSINATNWLLVPILITSTTALLILGFPIKASSISPSSIRCPLTFTWLSSLPKNSIVPSFHVLPASPVLYHLTPSDSTNFFSVNSLSPVYPFATPTPPINNSPLT